MAVGGGGGGGGGWWWWWVVQALVQGDIHVHFMDEDTLSKDDKMFGFWFHTCM